jgi:hypothetical protein
MPNTKRCAEGDSKGGPKISKVPGRQAHLKYGASRVTIKGRKSRELGLAIRPQEATGRSGSAGQMPEVRCKGCSRRCDVQKVTAAGGTKISKVPGRRAHLKYLPAGSHRQERQWTRMTKCCESDVL